MCAAPRSMLKHPSKSVNSGEESIIIRGKLQDDLFV